MKNYLYKYRIKSTLYLEENIYNAEVSLPYNATVVSAQWINGDFFIYAIADPTETMFITKKILVAPTGLSFDKENWEKLQKECHFLGTFQEMIEPRIFIWHLWMEK